MTISMLNLDSSKVSFQGRAKKFSIFPRKSRLATKINGTKMKWKTRRPVSFSHMGKCCRDFVNEQIWSSQKTRLEFLR